MDCQDFERLWNERLDGREAVGIELERALEHHAASCAECRARDTQFMRLGQAIGQLPRIEVPAGFADRCVSALRPAERARHWAAAAWTRRLAYPLAAAACLTAGTVAVLRLAAPPITPEIAQAQAPAADTASLPDALADATSATWQLALEASGPAARIGRDVLDTTVDRGSPGSSLASPSVTGAASDVLQSVGERVNEGVRPLSGSAKHAFGFLLGPALDGEKDAPRPS